MEPNINQTPIQENQIVTPTPIQGAKKKSKLLPILLAVLLILFIAAGAYALGKYTNKPNIPASQPTTTSLPSITPLPTTDAIADWKTYENKLWGFSLKYPQNNLIACSPTDENGLKLWTMPFDCPIGHDILYEVSAIGYKKTGYKEYKKPISTSKIQVDGKEATLNVIKYDETDGPLQSLIGSTEILIPTDNGLIQIVLLGEKPEQKERFNQILSTFRFLDDAQTTGTPISQIIYAAPSDWKKITLKGGLTLCLPSKWEYNGFADLEYNRDPGYKITITTIREIPYSYPFSKGSIKQDYFNFWKSEYPDIENLMTVKETEIKGYNVLTFFPANLMEAKLSPEGLTVVWFTANKLWKAGLSNWSMVNNSQTAFLNDFYKVISCSFGISYSQN